MMKIGSMRKYRHGCLLPNFEFLSNELDTFLQMAANGTERKLLYNRRIQEPDYTAAIVTEFPDIVRKYSRYVNWNLGACFAHQRPYVTYTNQAGKSVTCELADLLLVCHKNEDGQDRYNAALMQLKMGHWVDDYHQIHDQKELIQLELYEWWPKFVFKYRPMVTYDIMPKSVTPGAQYLFVNRSGEPLFAHAIPSQVMFNDSDYSLGSFLVAFTQWQTGRPISPENDHNQDDWSKAIWALIDGNRHSFYNRRNIQYKQVPRNNGDFLQLMTSQEYTTINNSYFEEYIKGDIPKYDKEEEEGLPTIPMLFIEL